MITRVIIAKDARKALKKLPFYVIKKLNLWAQSVARNGLDEVRKLPGYHDEPLKGQRKGQRSIRLSKTYRAIYVVKIDNSIEFVSVEEVNKHDY